ncbi:hypothetical protein WJX74_010051 [Apatococcus lobatus]
MQSQALTACIKRVGVANIRITPDCKSVSAIDVTRALCLSGKTLAGANANALTLLNRLVGWTPDGKIKFRGRGQQHTPIVSLERLPQLIRKLICKMRRSMKWKRQMLAEFGCCTEELDMEATVYVEAEVMPHLIKAFAACDPMPQFAIGPYRIDLYLAGPKIAVECDENGHSGYDKMAEATREAFVKETLGCSFARFNPHAPGFEVMDAVAAVVKAMVAK